MFIIFSMCVSLLSLVLVFLVGVARHEVQAISSFDDNYIITYGNDHFVYINQGQEIQLSLDQSNGAGFRSKQAYGSGFFQMKLKLPEQHSPGVVTSFYLHSNQPGSHDELDFEFLGSDGPPFLLQTNVFAGDNGGREQRIRLWFDPTKEFHNYAILRNQHQILFFVDYVPIRVYKKYEKYGGRYPTQQLFIEGSIWNGDGWGSGGRKIEWSKAPFRANYQGFTIAACNQQLGNNCSSSMFWWNNSKYWQLSPKQERIYNEVKKKYMYYDCCSVDKNGAFKECHVPS